jgi:hypothetical protein
LSRSPARVLAALYRANGRPISIPDIAAMLARPTTKNATQTVFLIRSALESEAVDHIQGVGYHLTESGMAECRRALKTLGAELLQFGDDLREAA